MDIGQFGYLAAAVANESATNTAPWWGPPALQLFGTLVGSLGGVWIGARLVGKRERAASEQKRVADVLFLTVTISGILERFASYCADVASDDGTYRGERDRDGLLRAQIPAPTLDYAGVDVVWMSLPGRLLDQIHAVPRRLENLERYLEYIAENDGDEDRYFADRRRRYAELGLKAAAVSQSLRQHAGLSPEIDPTSKTVPWLKEMLARRIRLDQAYDEQQRRTWATLAGEDPEREPPAN